jgi:hypothetical protein
LIIARAQLDELARMKPEQCARKLVPLLLSEEFGREPVADLRSA